MFSEIVSARGGRMRQTLAWRHGMEVQNGNRVKEIEGGRGVAAIRASPFKPCAQLYRGRS